MCWCPQFARDEPAARELILEHGPPAVLRNLVTRCIQEKDPSAALCAFEHYIERTAEGKNRDAEWIETAKRRIAQLESESARNAPPSLASEPNTSDTSRCGADQSVDGSLDAATGRRKEIDEYITEVHRKTGRRITRTEIWKTAGYKSRTEFERWERADPNRPNKAADTAFTRLLREKPHLRRSIS